MCKVHHADVFSSLVHRYRKEMNHPSFALMLAAYLTFSSVFSFGQKVNNDSLQRVWLNPKQKEPERLKAVQSIAADYFLPTRPDSALRYGQIAFDLAEKLGNRPNMAEALNTLGLSWYYKGEYPRAMEYYERSRILSEELKDEKGLATSYNLIGLLLRNQGKNDLALESHQKGLALMERLADKKGIAVACGSLALVHKSLGNISLALEYNFRSLGIKREIGDSRGVASSNINIGNIYQNQGESSRALQHYQDALVVLKKLKDEKGMASCYNNIGPIYRDMGDIPNAMKYYHDALAIYERIGDKKGMAAMYNLIGIVHRDQGETQLALEYHLKGLEAYEAIGDKKGTANTLNSLGTIYRLRGELTLAQQQYQRALELFELLKNKRGVASAQQNLGNSYQAQGNNEQALQFYRSSYESFKELEEKKGEIQSLANIAGILDIKDDLDAASANAEQALTMAKELGFPIELQHAAELLSQIYRKQNRYQLALETYQLAITMRDSVRSEENQKGAMRQQFQYEYEKKELSIQKEMELGALKFEYEKKQAAARSEKEKEQLRYEEVLKRNQIEADFEQKQLALLAEQRQKEALAKAEQEKKDELARAEIRRRNLQRNASLTGLGLMMLLAAVFFLQRNRISKEKQRSEDLLLNILPGEVAEELKAKGSADAQLFDSVSVLFTDFKGFTALSEQLSAKELVQDLNECFSAFDRICEKHGIEKIKTIGDAYMAAGGLPSSNQTHAQDVVQAALEMAQVVEDGKAKKMAAGLPFFEVRIGVHTGPVVAGIVGIKKFQYDIWGDTVNTASRMESSGEVGKVNISETTYELVKNKFAFEYRGEVEAKGKGMLKMYFASDIKS